MNPNHTDFAQRSLVEVADRYVSAYNDGDLNLLGALLSDDIRFWRHNQDFCLQGRDAVAQFFGEILAGFPNRQITDRRGIYTIGDQVIIEHTWTGTAALDVPGHADKGTTVRLEAATFLRIRDGLITEYHDYA